MKSRQFFVSNSIKNFQTLCKVSPIQQKNEQNLNTSSSKRIKRVTSCQQSSSKIDPSKFINRQVFNSKFYPSKAFNIAVQFRKEKDIEANNYFSFQKNETFLNLKNKFQQKKCGQEFVLGMKNVSHHMKNIFFNVQSIFFEAKKQQNLLKKQLFLLKQGFEKVLKILCKQIQLCQQKYVSALFAKKSQNFSEKVGDFSETVNKSLIHAQRATLSSSRTSRQLNRQKTFSQNSVLIEHKPSTSSKNLRQSFVRNQLQSSSLPNKLKSVNDKLGLVEFQNKKHILQIESLQTENKGLKEKINELQSTLNKMTDKISKVKQIEDVYNYKIKKLKQELQVAHIVKQQNLAQKMRYIMQNQ